LEAASLKEGGVNMNIPNFTETPCPDAIAWLKTQPDRVAKLPAWGLDVVGTEVPT